MKVILLLCSLFILQSSILFEKCYDDTALTVTGVNSANCIEKNTKEPNDFESQYLSSDEDVKNLVEDVYMNIRYPKLSERAYDDYTESWFYIDSDHSTIDQFRNYYLQFMNEECFNYLFQVLDIQIFNGEVIYNKESEFSSYEMDLDGEREIFITSRTDQTCQLKVPYKFSGMRHAEPDLDYGEVWLEKQQSGEWKIVKISQWLNDLIYYEFKDYKYIYFINSENHFQEFINSYGKNTKGDSISTEIIRNGEYILSDSDKRLLTEADLEPLSKISAVLAYYEIEARHGYVSVFGDAFISYELYFEYYCKWYTGNRDKNDLSEIEKANQEILKKYIEQF